MLVEQHADHERERVATHKLVGLGVLGNAQLWHAGGVAYTLGDA